MPNYTVVDEARDLIKPYVDTGDSAQESLTRSTVGFTGKNEAFSQTNNAVIAHIKNGKAYKVRWTGSATVTLKKDSASGTEVTSGSTSPLSFVADADFDLYFGSSADVTQIMVYDSALDDTYEANHVDVQTQLNAQTGITGVRNWLENTAVTTTSNGVTFTVYENPDSPNHKIVTVNGTATENAQLILKTKPDILENTDYILTGCPVGGGGGGSGLFNLQYSNHTNNTYVDTGKGIKIRKWNETTYPNAYVIIVIYQGYTANNLVFKPMIRLASDPDDTYVPYAMTNRELTEKVNATVDTAYTAGLGGSAYTGNADNAPLGFVVSNPSVTNLPVVKWGALETIKLSSTTSIQKFYNTQENEVYIRFRSSSTWGSWYKLTSTVVA